MSIDIKKLVDYQKALIDKKKMMNEYNKNEVVVTYMKVKKQRDDIKSEIDEKIKKITELTSLINNKSDEYEEFSKDLDFALQMKIQDQPVENLKYNLDKLQKESNAIDNYSKEISDLVAQVQDTYKKLVSLLQNDYQKITDKRNELRQGAEDIANKYKKLFDEIQKNITEIENSLNDEEKALFKKANGIVGNLPCISKLNVRSCSICGQEVGPEPFKKVAAEGYAVCPHCGRIIY